MKPRCATLQSAPVVKVYKDHGISGAKGRDRRPAFDALHKAAVRREFDVVMAWNVDRLGRSPGRTAQPRGRSLPASAGARHHDAGRQGDVPDARVFAEFERSIIQERVRAGQADTRRRGREAAHRFG